MDTNAITTNTPTPPVVIKSGRKLGKLAIRATIKDTQAKCFQILTEISNNLISVYISSGSIKDPYKCISMSGKIKEDSSKVIVELYKKQLIDRDEINRITDLTFSIDQIYNSLYTSYNITPHSYEISGTTDLRNKINSDRIAISLTNKKIRDLEQKLDACIISIHEYFNGLEKRLNNQAYTINTTNPYQSKRLRLQLLKTAADTEVLTMKNMRTELQNIIRNEYEQICKAAKPEERNEELGPAAIL